MSDLSSLLISKTQYSSGSGAQFCTLQYIIHVYIRTYHVEQGAKLCGLVLKIQTVFVGLLAPSSSPVGRK